MTNRKIIDFQLIWRKVHADLSIAEENELKEWLADSEENQKTFEQAVEQYKQEADIKLLADSEVEKAWGKVNLQLKPRKKSLNVWYWTAAASVVLILSTVFVFNFYNKQQLANSTIEHNSINPGSDKAVLITSDGNRVDLTDNRGINVTDGNTKITSNGKQLVYQNQQGKSVGENTILVPRGGKFSLVLSDGTKVWLNAESKLTYPIVFAENERNVTLVGEAYFEVKTDKNKPFRVLSDNQSVRVLGTSFNVKSYPEAEKIETTLVEGKVEVNLTRINQQTTLSPSQQAVYTRSTNQLTKATVDTDIYTGWKDDRFIFDEERLEDLLITLGRWYDVEVFYKNESQKNIRFTGEMKRQENFERILKLIQKTNSVQFTIKGNTVIVE